MVFRDHWIGISMSTRNVRSLPTKWRAYSQTSVITVISSDNQSIFIDCIAFFSSICIPFIIIYQRTRDEDQYYLCLHIKLPKTHIVSKRQAVWLVSWLVVFYVPSRARSFMDGTPFTVPCEGREAGFLHRSHRESNPGPSRGSLLKYRCATPTSPGQAALNKVLQYDALRWRKHYVSEKGAHNTISYIDYILNAKTVIYRIILRME